MAGIQSYIPPQKKQPEGRSDGGCGKPTLSDIPIFPEAKGGDSQDGSVESSKLEINQEPFAEGSMGNRIYRATWYDESGEKTACVVKSLPVSQEWYPIKEDRQALISKTFKEAGVEMEFRHPPAGLNENLFYDKDGQRLLLVARHAAPPGAEIYTLTDLLEKRIELDLSARYDILQAIANQLHLIHDSDMVHADLHSGNVIVYQIEGKWYAEVIDFGEAVLKGTSQKKNCDKRFWWPNYALVENWREVEGSSFIADEHIDLFSFAILIIKLLCKDGVFEDVFRNRWEVTKNSLVKFNLSGRLKLENLNECSLLEIVPREDREELFACICLLLDESPAPKLTKLDAEKLSKWFREKSLPSEATTPDSVSLRGEDDVITLADDDAMNCFSYEVYVGILSQVAEQLEAIHEQGDVHLNLGPEFISIQPTLNETEENLQCTATILPSNRSQKIGTDVPGFLERDDPHLPASLLKCRSDDVNFNVKAHAGNDAYSFALLMIYIFCDPQTKNNLLLGNNPYFQSGVTLSSYCKKDGLNFSAITSESFLDFVPKSERDKLRETIIFLLQSGSSPSDQISLAGFGDDFAIHKPVVPEVVELEPVEASQLYNCLAYMAACTSSLVEGAAQLVGYSFSNDSEEEISSDVVFKKESGHDSGYSSNNDSEDSSADASVPYKTYVLKKCLTKSLSSQERAVVSTFAAISFFARMQQITYSVINAVISLCNSFTSSIKSLGCSASFFASPSNESCELFSSSRSFLPSIM